MTETERTLAVFIDFENLAIGFKHRRGEFDIHKILERLVEKGKVIVKKAYADWGEYKQYTKPLHENAIELIEIPRRQLRRVHLLRGFGETGRPGCFRAAGDGHPGGEEGGPRPLTGVDRRSHPR